MVFSGRRLPAEQTGASRSRLSARAHTFGPKRAPPSPLRTSLVRSCSAGNGSSRSVRPTGTMQSFHSAARHKFGVSDDNHDLSAVAVPRGFRQIILSLHRAAFSLVRMDVRTLSPVLNTNKVLTTARAPRVWIQRWSWSRSMVIVWTAVLLTLCKRRRRSNGTSPDGSFSPKSCAMRLLCKP